MPAITNLFKRLSDLNITAQELSKATKISNGNISDWKSGRSLPTAQKLILLADYLSCSVDYLLGRTDNINISTPDITPAIASNRMEKELLDMFRQLDYEAQDDIFDFIKLKYNKCVKKEIEKSCMSTGIESDIA